LFHSLADSSLLEALCSNVDFSSRFLARFAQAKTLCLNSKGGMFLNFIKSVFLKGRIFCIFKKPCIFVTLYLGSISTYGLLGEYTENERGQLAEIQDEQAAACFFVETHSFFFSLSPKNKLNHLKQKRLPQTVDY